MALGKKIVLDELGIIDAYFNIESERTNFINSSTTIILRVYFNKSRRDANIDNYLKTIEVPVGPVSYKTEEDPRETLYLAIMELDDWKNSLRVD